MSWTHSICGGCFEAMHPGRVPVRVVEPDREYCCYCGRATYGGIYIRADPSVMSCSHEDDD